MRLGRSSMRAAQSLAIIGLVDDSSRGDDVELRQIQYLCAVVETGSFTRAADKCMVSQSAVSQQVKALEGELGFELLHRHGRSFSVTPAGELFARKASHSFPSWTTCATRPRAWPTAIRRMAV